MQLLVVHLSVVLVTTANVILFCTGDIVNLDELVNAIKTGPNRKVAFLAEANFKSVHTVLPSEVQAVICDGEEHYKVKCQGKGDIVKLVENGGVIAALISGLPEEKEAKTLHAFSSTLISPRAMLMAPDISTDHPHGAPPERSTRDLALALNSAIVRVQTKGLDQEARKKNMPFEFLNVHTCKSSDYGMFPIPNKADAKGLLRKGRQQQPSISFTCP